MNIVFIAVSVSGGFAVAFYIETCEYERCGCLFVVDRCDVIEFSGNVESAV